jgi:hypothetical protein
MKIEGEQKNDKSEVNLKITFENEAEFNMFHHFFHNMIEEMVKAMNAIAIDVINQTVIGDVEGNDELIQEALQEAARSISAFANKEAIPELRLNFIK